MFSGRLRRPWHSLSFNPPLFVPNCCKHRGINLVTLESRRKNSSWGASGACVCSQLKLWAGKSCRVSECGIFTCPRTRTKGEHVSTTGGEATAPSTALVTRGLLGGEAASAPQALASTSFASSTLLQFQPGATVTPRKLSSAECAPHCSSTVYSKVLHLSSS